MVESMQWKSNESTVVMVVDKNDFTKRRLFELPAMMVFHFSNAWEENNVIHLDFVLSKDLSIMNEWMPKMMRAEDAPPDAAHPSLLTINLDNGKLELQDRKENVEFPRIDPRYVAQKNQFIYYPCSPKDHDQNHFAGVMRLDVKSGNVDQFHFKHGVSLEGHVVVPKPDSTKEGDAWLIGVGFDFKKPTSFSTIFDAQKLANGPLAIVHLPYWAPSCFHGNFY